LTACASPTSAPSEGPTTTHVVNEPAPKPQIVDGVPLIPITPGQRSKCVIFANRLKRRVPCPGLLPKPIPVSPESPDSSCLYIIGETACGPAYITVSNTLVLSQSNFEVPPGYVGVTFQQYSGAVVPEPSVTGGPLGHFVFTTGGPKVPSYCLPMPVTKAVRIDGKVPRLYQCLDTSAVAGELELIIGHDLLVWDDAGVTTEVSFHGHSQVNVDLDIAVANATVLVPPSTT